MKRSRSVLVTVALATLAASTHVTSAEDKPGDVNRKPDVIFVPTPAAVVAKMLTMAKVGPNDVVYDLGCGDGRIPIAAVRDFKAKSAVCVDIDPVRIQEARANVKKAGLEDKIEVRHADMFTVDTSRATVVTLYLLEQLNLRLRPKLLRELRPGARIVSQSFGMGDWKPAQQARVDDKPVYLWHVTKKEKSEQQARR